MNPVLLKKNDRKLSQNFLTGYAVFTAIKLNKPNFHINPAKFHSH
jgi:hypothetical protein